MGTTIKQSLKLVLVINMLRGVRGSEGNSRTRKRKRMTQVNTTMSTGRTVTIDQSICVEEKGIHALH